MIHSWEQSWESIARGIRLELFKSPGIISFPEEHTESLVVLGWGAEDVGASHPESGLKLAGSTFHWIKAFAYACFDCFDAQTKN